MSASNVGRTSARPACCSTVCLDRPAYRFENVPRVYSSGGAAQLDGSPQIVSGGKLWNPLQCAWFLRRSRQRYRVGESVSPGRPEVVRLPALKRGLIAIGLSQKQEATSVVSR